jgi:hypothetical protein
MRRERLIETRIMAHESDVKGRLTVGPWMTDEDAAHDRRVAEMGPICARDGDRPLVADVWKGMRL